MRARARGRPCCPGSPARERGSGWTVKSTRHLPSTGSSGTRSVTAPSGATLIRATGRPRTVARTSVSSSAKSVGSEWSPTSSSPPTQRRRVHDSSRARPGVVRVAPADPRQRRERPPEAPERRPQVVPGEGLAVRSDRAVEERVRLVDRSVVGRPHRAVGVDRDPGLAQPARGRVRGVVDVADPRVEELVLVTVNRSARPVQSTATSSPDATRSSTHPRSIPRIPWNRAPSPERSTPAAPTRPVGRGSRRDRAARAARPPRAGRARGRTGRPAPPPRPTR